MGLRLILDFLEKYPKKKYTSSQIKDTLGIGNIFIKMSKLRLNDEVNFENSYLPVRGKDVWWHWHKEASDA